MLCKERNRRLIILFISVQTDSPVMTDLELPKSGHLYSGRNPTSLREPSARSQELEEFSRAAAKKPASRREHSAKVNEL